MKRLNLKEKFNMLNDKGQTVTNILRKICENSRNSYLWPLNMIFL